MSEFPAEWVEAARVSKAWPFEEAKKLVERTRRRGFDGEVLFETGYGPSGLPHIGTLRSARSRAPRWCVTPSAC
jgi:lysyl-tRNA synthetase class 1